MFIMANDIQAFAKRSVKILKRFTIILICRLLPYLHGLDGESSKVSAKISS